jgi:hypothetical protein
VYLSGEKIATNYKGHYQYDHDTLNFYAFFQAACLIRVPVEVVKQRAQAFPEMSSQKIFKSTLQSEGWPQIYMIAQVVVNPTTIQSRPR